MKIGVNCFMLQAHMGGLKQYFTSLFDWLLDHDKTNEYVLFYFAHNVPELQKLRVDWQRSAVLLNDQADINRHLRSVDLYFCPFGVLWPRPVPVPSVVTLVDIQEVFYPEFFTRGDLLSRAVHFPGSTRAADRVITISEFSKGTIAKHHQLGPDRIDVAYLCPDPRYFDAASVAEEVPVPFSEFVVFPANRWLHKNHDALLRAMRILKSRGEVVNAVFTGFDTAGGYPLMKKAGEYGVTDQIHVAGYVNLAQMAWLYRAAEMLVFPSLFEGFGMPPVEAMACGCPVVVSTSTCLPEICADAAVYFDPTDPEALAGVISRIRADRSFRQILIGRGLERAQLFSAERMATVHLQSFTAAAAGFSAPRYWWQRILYQPYHRVRAHAVHALRYRPRPSDDHSCRVKFGNGWCELERTGKDWLRWSTGAGTLNFHAPADLKIRIEGELASFSRPNEVQLLVNRRAVWSRTIEGDFGFEPFSTVIDCTAGKVRLSFVSRCPGVPASATDPRKLAIAVRNLRFSDGDERCTFRLE
jgi:glycosyltransferase involved in cell wall biosynthesis